MKIDNIWNHLTFIKPFKYFWSTLVSFRRWVGIHREVTTPTPQTPASSSWESEAKTAFFSGQHLISTCQNEGLAVKLLASYLLRSEKNLSAKNDNWGNMATATKYLTMDFGINHQMGPYIGKQ